MNKYGVTLNGFIRPSFNDILAELQRLAKVEFGDDLNVDDNSAMGKFLKVIAWKESDLWEVFEDSYYQTHLRTARGNGLDGWGSNHGEKRLEGSKAISENVEFKGSAGIRINKGFRVSTQTGLVYETTHDFVFDSEGNGKADVKSLDIGVKYNVPEGRITEIVNPSIYVTEVYNPNPAIDGSDIEDDISFRERLEFKVQKPITGDNKNQYELWARQVAGVGAARAVRATPKPGFTTLVISTKEGTTASDDLIGEVEDYINPMKPINAGLVVKSAESKMISVNATIDYNKNIAINKLQEELEKDIRQFFASIPLETESVSLAKMTNVILTNDNVLDITSLTMNGKRENVPLTLSEVPILDKLVIEVV